MSYSNPAVTLSIRIPSEIREQLDDLSHATGRTKSFLAAEAIENYLAAQSWQVKAIEKAIEKADSNNVRFIEHNKVIDWVNSWDSESERKIPK